MTKKWVYLFSEGNKEMRDLLGGKGAGLAEMTNVGLPVPPGFTCTTEACLAYFDAGKKFPQDMWQQVREAVQVVEDQTGKKFGDAENPLLVSVRSGARVSMPGMMDTVLNVGLNPETVKGLAKLAGNERFAYDSYRRLISMFGRIVKEIDGELFEDVLESYKAKAEGGRDSDLTVEMLQQVVGDYKAIYKAQLGEDFPDDVWEQLYQAIEAVFDSWFGANATTYRRLNKMSDDWGTGVNICTMVFGNMGDDSGTGVAFTRNPNTGEKSLYGEYLVNAQGEDVVAGIRTPLKITDLEQRNPEIYEQFSGVAEMLERHYRDMQDLELTVEKGHLWILQTRTGKRTARAAIKIAVDQVDEGLISKEEALLRVTTDQVDAMLHPMFDPKAKLVAIENGDLITKGLNASPGAATGVAIFDSARAMERAEAGDAVILVRPETSPDDVGGMLLSKGVLTQHGGATSHAAVVARGNNLPCVVGCEEISVDTEACLFTLGLHRWDHRRGFCWDDSDHRNRPSQRGESIHFAWLGRRGPPIGRLYQCGLSTRCQAGARVRCRGHRSLPDGAHVLRGGAPPRRRGDDHGQERGRPEQVSRGATSLPVIIRLIDPPMHEFLPQREDLMEEVIRLRCTEENPAELAEKEKMLAVVPRRPDVSWPDRDAGEGHIPGGLSPGEKGCGRSCRGDDPPGQSRQRAQGRARQARTGR